MLSDLLRPLAILLCLTALAGCGYQPLYAETQSGVAISEELAAVKVEIIPDRRGQILRNYLLQSLNPSGQPDSPDYSLRVNVSEVRQDLGIQDDATRTRSNLRVTATYTLNTVGGERVTSGTITSITSYNVLADEFATLSAERAARDRALRQLSEDIRTRLALHFAREA